MAIADQLDFGTFVPFEPGTGTSEAASKLEDEIREVRQSYVEESVTYGEPYQKGMRALEECISECSSENWDGYEAQPVCEESAGFALSFLRSLPPNLPSTPDISADPDGEVSFEWYLARSRVFSVSVGKGGRLSYAGLFGAGRVHGTEYWLDELPKAILQQMGRLFSEAD